MNEKSDQIHVSIMVDGIDITQPHEDWIDKCTPTPKKKNATFWRGFHIAKDDRNGRGKLYAVCNVCGHVLISHNSGTTNLRRHMKSYHMSVFERLLEIQETEERIEGNSQKKRNAFSDPVPHRKLKKAKDKKTIKPIEWAELSQALYCISSNRPFSILDNPALKTFVKACEKVGKAGGGFVPNSSVARRKATDAIEKVRWAVKEKIREAKNLVLSIDFWETPSQLNSAYVAIRWIESFQLRHCVIRTIKYQGEVNIKQLLTSIHEDLKKWEVPKDRISFLVSNFDLSNEAFCSKYNFQVIQSLDYCLEQVLGYSLSASFESSVTINDSNVRELTAGLQEARVLIRKLDKKEIVICDETVSRWWATLFMLESLVDYQSAIQSKINAKDIESSWTTHDWDTLKRWKDVLKAFHPAIKMLSENQNCTSSLVPFIQFVIHSELLKIINAEGVSRSGQLATVLFNRFEKEFGAKVTCMETLKKSSGIHINFLLAHALDPRFKQLKVIPGDEEKDKLWHIVLDKMVEVVKKSNSSSEGKTKSSSNVGGDVEAASILRNVAIKDAGHEITRDNIFDQYAGVLESGQAKDERSWKTECQNELKLYRAESTAGMRTENGKEDPLSWWKSHRVAFPTLWQLAKIYLAIPATSSSPRLAFNAPASALALERFVLSEDLPEDSDFLHENSWVLNEYL